jgi:uncharacterized protein (DUF2249 family)
MPMNSSTEIDVRGLAPPEPFELILPALFTLAPGASLQVLIHREPFPLYDFLRKSGYIWKTYRLSYNNFRIRIIRAAS